MAKRFSFGSGRVYTVRSFVAFLVALALITAVLFTGVVDPTGSYDAEVSTHLQVHFIDVGQGDAILVNLPNGENMLVDAGDNHYGSTVVDYLTERDMHTVDYLVGTHPHADHIGGMDDVIVHFDIGNVYLPDRTANTQTYYDLLEAIDRKNLTVTTAKQGVTLLDIDVNGQRLQAYMIGPVRDNYSNTNDHSAVIKLVYGSVSFLLTGDAEEAAENDMVDAGENLSATILKVGHHGSHTSTTDDFLNEVNPTVAVIQVGEDNRYNHPADSTIQKLQEQGIRIYRTDMNGTVVFTTTGSGWLVNKQPWWQP